MLRLSNSMPSIRKNIFAKARHVAKKGRVFVGMSGGVDSSVSAAILQKEGYEVTGVYIKTWSPEWLPCTWREERRDAMRVAAHLGIPFLTIDLEKEYKERVADLMIEGYKAGLTPNPDILCNKEIKFGSFLRKALEMGADLVATGHYAQIQDGLLAEGADKNKDQSYFLWTLSKEQLTKIIFPVGHMQKSGVRGLARFFGLSTAEKKDSQGICFIGDVDMKEFLQHYLPVKEGKVLDERGVVIGHHDGAWFYTIGERHGFTVTKKGPSDAPQYIVAKDVKTNTLVVSEKGGSGNASQDSFAVRELALKDIVWHGKEGGSFGVRIRYRQEQQRCAVTKEGDTLRLKLEVPQHGIALGQSAVIYDGEVCMGGGVIAEAVHV